LRNTAVRLTNQTAEVIQSLAFTDPWVLDNDGLGPTSTTHNRDDVNADQNQKGFPRETQVVRGSGRTYTISWGVSDLNDNLKQVDIAVSHIDPKEGATITNNSVIYKHKAL
jgi:hypothetical protein